MAEGGIIIYIHCKGLKQDFKFCGGGANKVTLKQMREGKLSDISTEWRSRVRGQIRNVRSAMNSFSGRSNPARVASGVPV